MWAKQSTAATLIVGPILDSAGAEYTGAVIGDLSISKNGGTLTALAAAATLTHIANGQYTLVMTTGNLDTLGRLQITCNKSTYQMPPIGLNVVPAMVFDSLILGSDDLDTNTKKWNDLTTVALPLVPTTAGRTLDVDAAGAVELDSAVAAQIDNIENASGYLLAVQAGACADPQTASETYTITIFGSTFTVDMAGQTSTGTRTAPTLTKV